MTEQVVSRYNAPLAMTIDGRNTQEIVRRLIGLAAICLRAIGAMSIVRRRVEIDWDDFKTTQP